MKRLHILILAASLCVTMLPACTRAPASGDTSAPPATEATIPSGTAGEDVTTPAEETAPPVALEITEVMPDNRSLVLGHEYDWVEL